MAPLHAARRSPTVVSRTLIVVVIAAVVMSVGWLAAGHFAVGGDADASAGSTSSTSASPTARSLASSWAASTGRAPGQSAMHRSRSQPSHTPRALSRRAEHWRGILQSLDQVRARAWRQVSPSLLRRVYLPSAPEAQRDVSMLRRYAQRGLRVDGVRLAFGAVTVARQTPELVRLRVIDQLREATAIDQRGRRLELPRDSPTRHMIELRRSAGSWRIADVRLR